MAPIEETKEVSEAEKTPSWKKLEDKKLALDNNELEKTDDVKNSGNHE